jgi:DNA-binding transcriptional ArsR family regulator
MADKGSRGPSPQRRGKLKQVIDPAIAKGLSHPLRSHILVALGNRVASPTEIAKEIGIAPRDLNYHVKVLVEVGMIRLVRTEKRRGATEHFYELEKPSVYIDPPAWRQMPEQVRSTFSASLLQVVVDDAAEALQAGTFNARQSHQSRTPMLLDERGWAEVTQVMSEALEKMLAIEEKCTKNLDPDDGDGIPIEICMFGFETAAGAERRGATMAADGSS